MKVLNRWKTIWELWHQLQFYWNVFCSIPQYIEKMSLFKNENNILNSEFPWVGYTVHFFFYMHALFSAEAEHA